LGAGFFIPVNETCFHEHGIKKHGRAQRVRTRCKAPSDNDELIARGISPFQPEKVSIEAGRLMLKRIEELMNDGQVFSFETTLSSKTFLNTVIDAKAKGYFVTLIFFWLDSVQLAKDRVRKRVLEGGHFIADHVIERRYKSGIKNLFTIYHMHVDSLLIYDNSNAEASLIAEKEKNNDFVIHASDKFQSIKAFYHEQ